jgi:hypothetical protein
MATTQTLNAKYPDWTKEDWDRFHWINSWNRCRRNLAPLLPCKRCGTAAIFEEDHADMPYHNMFTLGCPKCHRYLETTTDLSPIQFWGGFGDQRCTFSVVQNRVPLHMVRQWNYYNSPAAQRKNAKLLSTQIALARRGCTGDKVTASPIGSEPATQLTMPPKGRNARTQAQKQSEAGARSTVKCIGK